MPAFRQRSASPVSAWAVRAMIGTRAFLGSAQVADRSGRRKTVHDRHLHVHEHHVEILPIQCFHRLPTIAGNLYGVSTFAENIGKQLLVRRDILG